VIDGVGHDLRARQRGGDEDERTVVQVIHVHRRTRQQPRQLEAGRGEVRVQVERRIGFGWIPAAAVHRRERGIEWVRPLGIGQSEPGAPVGEPYPPRRHG
jgi:hypothetical protein